MITRLDRLQGRDIYENTALAKINELVDAVNNQQIQLNNHECRLLDLHSRITALDDPTYHEAESELADPYAEQRKWIGKLCRFWRNNEDWQVYARLHKIYPDQEQPYESENLFLYECCEPVSPEDDIVFKGE